MAISKRPQVDRTTQEQTHQRIAPPRADESKRLHVPVPPDLYRRMKHQAADEDRSVAAITRELWQQYLDQQGHE